MTFGTAMVTLGMCVMMFAPGWYGGYGIPFCLMGLFFVWRECQTPSRLRGYQKRFLGGKTAKERKV